MRTNVPLIADRNCEERSEASTATLRVIRSIHTGATERVLGASSAEGSKGWNIPSLVNYMLCAKYRPVANHSSVAALQVLYAQLPDLLCSLRYSSVKQAIPTNASSKDTKA